MLYDLTLICPHFHDGCMFEGSTILHSLPLLRDLVPTTSELHGRGTVTVYTARVLCTWGCS